MAGPSICTSRKEPPTVEIVRAALVMNVPCSNLLPLFVRLIPELCAGL
jgi:hypothetical protein